MTLDDWLARTPAFDGAVYNPKFDQKRLTKQIRRVFDAISDGRFRTLREIAAITGDPEASISAQIRNLKKQKFGAWGIEMRKRGDRAGGLWEYRLHR